MFWPILASTATTLAAFLPIMFWPGVAGQFMSYLPITVFAVLIGSLLYALLFAPTIGALIGRFGAIGRDDASPSRNPESGKTENTHGITAIYARILDLAVRMPVAVFVLSILMLITIVTAYGRYGKGVEFFTGVEPSQTQIQVFARGNFYRLRYVTLCLM